MNELEANTPAFSYDQIVAYMGKIRRKTQIDNPTAVIKFITAAASKQRRGKPPALSAGQSGVIQCEIEGKASTFLHSFTLCYDEELTKSWWRPVANETYSEFKYCGFEPL